MTDPTEPTPEPPPTSASAPAPPEPAPAPAEAAPAPAASSPSSRSTRSPLALVALVGALLVIGATFAPWLGQGGDLFGSDRIEFTGWDFYERRAEIVEDPNPFVFEESFAADDTPFFGGLATVIAGAAVGIVAVGLLVLRGRSSALDVVLTILAILAGALVLVVCFTNLVSYLRAGDTNLAGLKWGLVVVWIGAFLGAALFPASMLRGSSETAAA